MRTPALGSTGLASCRMQLLRAQRRENVQITTLKPLVVEPDGGERLPSEQKGLSSRLRGTNIPTQKVRLSSQSPFVTPAGPPPLHDDDSSVLMPGAEPFGWSKFTTSATKGMLLLNLAAALFGSNQVIIKAAEEMMSPFALNALRFSVAALCFAPLLPKALKEVPLPLAMELGCWLTLGYTFQAIGLVMTSSSHGAFAGAFTVLTIPFLVGVSGKPVDRSIWFSSAAAVFGISLLTGDGGQPNLGDVTCIASAVLFGVHTWRAEAISGNVDDTKGLAALQLWVLAICSIALAMPELIDAVDKNGIVGVLEQSKALPWESIMFMGAVTTALNLYIELEALKDVAAETAALIYTAEPIWGAIFAWVVLNERWGMQGWAGAALVVSSSLFSQVCGTSATIKYEPEARQQDAKKK